VIGGGISGLAAAHRLVELRPGCRLVLFEAAPRLGGVLDTLHEQGFQVEQSADNFITTVPWGVGLCKRIGMADELIQTNSEHRKTFVVRSGRLCHLPDGFLMMAPTRLWPLAVTPILSPLGKFRAALEYFIPPRTTGEDESMAAFVRRRLGREVFERLVEPLVSAVYAADLERLSVEATLVQFREMELEHGSLIRAMRYRMKNPPKTGPNLRSAPGDTGARYSMFVTPRNGLSSMVERIASRLPPGAIRLGARVERIERREDGRWGVVLADAATEAAQQQLPSPVSGEGSGVRAAEVFDAVILATPSYEAARLLAPLDAELAAKLATIEHSGTAIVSVGYDRRQIAHPLDGMGVVIPGIENSPMLACSFSSQKYPHRAPEGKVLLRVFAGGAKRPELAEMEDERLLPLVLGELGRLLGVRGEPCYTTIAHWPRTMPQYHVGHKRLVEEIRARVRELPHIALAGNAYQGVGIPHCIHSGEQAAEAVLASSS
jgi:oxygen-dependent protoporphyrinogen oxidase